MSIPVCPNSHYTWKRKSNLAFLMIDYSQCMHRLIYYDSDHTGSFASHCTSHPTKERKAPGTESNMLAKVWWQEFWDCWLTSPWIRKQREWWCSTKFLLCFYLVLDPRKWDNSPNIESRYSKLILHGKKKCTIYIPRCASEVGVS